MADKPMLAGHSGVDEYKIHSTGRSVWTVVFPHKHIPHPRQETRICARFHLRAGLRPQNAGTLARANGPWCARPR
jgi:hypothetical protein